MLEELLSTVGLPNLVLIIVGLSLLIVVVLLMSYFRQLITIASFTYPNAKFRAHGNPFVKKEELEPLTESKNINEIYSKIRENNYQIPKEGLEDIGDVEEHLEKETIELLKKAYVASPENAKPLVNVWIKRYDIKMIKRAVKGVARGKEKEEILRKLYPVKALDEEMIDEIASATNLQEVMGVLKDTEFEEVLAGRDWEDDFFGMDVALDRFIFEKMRQAVMKVGTEEKAHVKYFFGRYTDISNLKIVFRGLREDVDKEEIKDSLLPSGRELEEWKLEDMIDSNNAEEAMVELEGTSYEDLRTEGTSMSDFDLEKYLDKRLLDIVSEISSQQILTVGPIIKYLVSKDVELRNLKTLIRGLREELDSDRIKELMIMEENT